MFLHNNVGLWAGSISTSAECVNSVGRVVALETGHQAIIKKLDGNVYYTKTIQGLDVVAILTSLGAIKDVVKTGEALNASGIEWDNAIAGALNRQQRLNLTTRMGLVGSKRVAAQTISKVVKVRILAAVSTAVGMATSSAVGATHDLIVWMISPKQTKQ